MRNYKLALVALLVFLDFFGIFTSHVFASSTIGNLENIDANGTVTGWVFDPDASDQSIAVHFYVDGTPGTGILAAGIATDISRPDVNTGYNIQGLHGFSGSIPSQYKDGGTHTLYVYGIDTTAGATNVQVLGSPKSFTLSTPPPPASPASLINMGWDPGLNQRRAAFYKTDPTVYFESCPDYPGGCYNNGNGIPIGGGFYTISKDIGGASPCKINSGSLFDVALSNGALRKEPCPFYFNWATDSTDRPAAKITLDTSTWTSAFSPNIYMGFHENMPQGNIPNGVNYFGGKNLPNINDAYLSVDLSGNIFLPVIDSSRTRFLAGVTWYAPSLNKSFVVEMNLNYASNGFIQPAWSTTDPVFVNQLCGSPDLLCLYLGGQYWGITSVSQSKKTLTIDWANIAQQLVVRGDLPSQALGPYQTGAFYIGPETLGKSKAELTISNFRIQSKASSSTPPPPPPPSTVLAGDLNGDRVINSIDFSTMNSRWLMNDTTSDLNRDGTVNSLDFSIMNGNWLKTY